MLWRPRFLNIRACPLPTPVFAAGSLGHESIGTPYGSSRGMDGKYDPAALQETIRYDGNVDSLSDCYKQSFVVLSCISDGTETA